MEFSIQAFCIFGTKVSHTVFEVSVLKYNDLQALIQSSTSTRNYFLSLPVAVQIVLHEQNDHIHTAEELHTHAENIIKYQMHLNIGKEYK